MACKGSGVQITTAPGHRKIRDASRPSSWQGAWSAEDPYTKSADACPRELPLTQAIAYFPHGDRNRPFLDDGEGGHGVPGAESQWNLVLGVGCAPPADEAGLGE